MDLAHFVWMMSHRGLWLARADTFDDPHEGAFGRANLASRPEMYADVTNYEAEQLSAWFASIRRRTFINCWHQNDYESAAMWSIYARRGEGVAVQTTFRALTGSLQGDRDVHAGTVRYVDLDKNVIPEGSEFKPFLHKRMSFECEQEVRLIASTVAGPQDNEQPPLGFVLPVDLHRLIGRVYVGPGQPSWFHDSIASLLEKYLGGTARLARSGSDDMPLY